MVDYLLYFVHRPHSYLSAEDCILEDVDSDMTFSRISAKKRE